MVYQPLCDASLHYGRLQGTRLYFDVMLLGPFMMWFSQYGPTPLAKEIMFWSGAATIAVNGVNYLCLRERA